MKNLEKCLALALFTCWPSFATTYYVDPGCQSAGTATSDTCGATGPKKTIEDGIALLSGGDTLEIRGLHAAHGNGTCSGFDGVFATDRIMIHNKAGSSGSKTYVQGYKYGQAGVERPNITGEGAVTWTQCSTCDGSDNIACQNLTGLPSACSQYWYVYPSGYQDRAFECVKTDGTPCYRLPNSLNSGKSDMSNSHTGYVATVCGNYPWIKCNTNPDCPDHASCGGNSAEVDAVSKDEETHCGYIVARWGSETRGTVIYDNNGTGFDICNTQWLTVRGLSFRNFRRNGISIEAAGDGGCSGASDNVTVTDNYMVYTHDVGGSDHMIASIDVTGITVTSNYIAYDGSESIHTHAKSGGSVYTIQSNFIRDNGDWKVLGTRTGGEGYGTARTPECMTIGNDGSANNDYAGSDISNNFCLRNMKNGLLIEGAKNIAIHDNFIVGSGRSGIKFSSEGFENSGHDVYNNFIVGPGVYANGDGGMWFSTGGNGTIALSKAYNNTFILTVSGVPGLKANDESITYMTFRNDLLWSNVGAKAVDWAATSSTNILENALVSTSSNPAVTWKGAHSSGGPDYTCAQMTNIASSDLNNCPSPNFVNSSGNDYHIGSTSPAKDTGTSTGMPSGRTRDIYNPLAGVCGFPSYSGSTDNASIQGGAWDIGADEIPLPVLDVSKADSPDPVQDGADLTYTITYHNTGIASASSVTIRDTVPTHTSFSSASGGGTLSGGVVTWNIGTVMAGGSGSVQLVVTLACPLGLSL